MKRFSWPLQRLLDLALQKEQVLEGQLARLAAEIAALRQEARRLREDISRRLRELSAVALAERLRRREMFAVWSGAGAGDHTALVGGADTG